MSSHKILLWSITVALGGFLFGFDTAVISGAEQAIQNVWNLDDFNHGLAIAIALYGTVIGALFGGIPSDKLGRKRTLIWVAALYLISALGSALATDQYLFMFFRFIGGIGVGTSSVVAPMYISEISPANKRGQLVALFQFNVVLGILIAYVSNYFLDGVSVNSWRWMLGVEAVPALFFLTMVIRVPRSPRWLIIKKHNEEEARKVLEIIAPESVDQAIMSIRQSAGSENASGIRKAFDGQYNFQFMLVFLFAFFNQFSGINAIIYYAPRIFNLTGASGSSALLSTAGIGFMNLIFTLLGMYFIDRVGRKKLMYIGSFGLIVSLSLVAYSFYIEKFSLLPVYLFAYISFFAMSQGAVIWVFISEIFPNDIRAVGQSFGSFIHWILAAIIANTFPYFVSVFEASSIFLFFAFMMVLQLLYVWKMMPETKGRSLEEISAEFAEENSTVKIT
ncbi:sugar porter family MFS transporter [Marinigracilibium pacificum]|uniref:Sugar porter family MFS transporter n=1 Tax=Marinigracilibium pacificum TaxID=2729599 RepID=A0A848J595_9BACT|nr:sugar porter family MFS transporter [Marinigracilibium pacificum]NMM49529.1 sugar porter family MFS transporter [Marinigracilibium pacificum]